MFLSQWNVGRSCVSCLTILATGRKDIRDDSLEGRAFWIAQKRSNRLAEVGASAGSPAYIICWSAENLVRQETNYMKENICKREVMRAIFQRKVIAVTARRIAALYGLQDALYGLPPCKPCEPWLSKSSAGAS